MSIDILRDLMMLLPDTLHTLEQAVMRTLQDHEPRLTLWRLREATRVGAQGLTLYVAACLPHLLGEYAAHIDIDIMASGHTTVRLAS